jgi:hypothetical protein
MTMSGGDERRADVDREHDAEGDAEERDDQDSGQVDTAHEDVVPFDKESRLDELDPEE